MAIVVKSSIKSNFETGDKPTQADFVELIDESIPNWFEDWKVQVDAGTVGVIEVISTASATTRAIGVVGAQLLTVGTTASAQGALGSTLLVTDVSNSLTVGMVTTSFNAGATLSSATTLHISDGNIQHGTMTGAFTLTAPDDTDDGYLELELTMDGTGGYALTLSGFNEISGTFDNTASTVNLLRVSKLNTNTYLEITQAV